MKKRKKFNFHNKMKKFNRAFLINLIAVIVIPIISILTAFYTAEKMYSVDKNATPPVFFLKRESNAKDNIKITNIGGMVSYLSFYKKTEIRYTLGNRNYGFRISYKDKSDLMILMPNINRINTWYYEPLAPNIDSKRFEKIFKEILKKESIEEYSTFFRLMDYYTLSYYDYENNYHENDYQIESNGLGVYDDRPKNMEGMCSYAGMLATDKNENLIYEKFKDYIQEEIDIVYHYQDWLKKKGYSE